jgi:hypothetical protein
VVIGGGSFLGQLAGPLLVGYTKSISTDFGASFIALGIAGICGGLMLLAVRDGGRTNIALARLDPNGE